MQNFHKILYILNHDLISETLVENASLITSKEDGHFTFFVSHPLFSEEMTNIKDAYVASVRAELDRCVSEISNNLSYDVVFDDSKPVFISVIHKVVREDYDLVMKIAENYQDKKTKGFRSHNLKLLSYGHTIAEKLSGSLQIVSCWRLENEEFLRSAAFSKMQDSEVDEIIERLETKHANALKKVIDESNVSISEDDIFIQRGDAKHVIPKVAETENTDIMIMGTVARTGIAGFFIGNTAENIMQDLNCSLFAVKPNGFISPVKAY